MGFLELGSTGRITFKFLEMGKKYKRERSINKLIPDRVDII